MTHRYIDKDKEFRTYLDGLQDAKCQIMALDTEANLHRYAYGQQLCLIQIFDGSETVLVDPFEIKRSNLREFFENRDILKVMYDAASDISLLVNSEGFGIKSILDLRPGVELLNYQKNDLYSVLSVELGINLENKRKFQQYNWLRRPLPEEALEYAANDVRYALKLKDIIIEKLYRQELLDSFTLKNLKVQNRDYFIEPATRHRRVKGFHTLAPDEKSLFKTLFFIREKFAEQINMPAANVIGNNQLLNISRDSESVDDLRLPRKLDDNVRRDITTEIRDALTRNTAHRPEE